MLESLISLDKEIFLKLNGLGAPTLDAFMVFVSGKLEWIPFYALLIFVLFRKYRLKTFYILFFVVILITLGDQTSVNLFKNIFMRFRPCHDPDLEGLVYIVNNHCGGQYGFVSSHATNTFSLAVFVSFLLKNKWWTSILIIWAIIVSYSRVYLGVHFPLDIICGAILGVLVALVDFKLMKFINRKFNLGINLL